MKPFLPSPSSAALMTTAALALALGGHPQGSSGSDAGGDAGIYPGREWAWETPVESGFHEDGLKAFVDSVEGAGCVVRHGNMVHAWGNFTDRADIASASKPVYAHLAYTAVEKGLIDGLGSPVSRHVPALKELNASLGHKDRLITWRHLLNQVSGYGVSEKPGTAFDYSDYQTALLVDALVHEVYGSDFSRIDEEVLRPLLTGPLGCQDDPVLAGGPRSHPGRLRISARDLARFGLLYLDGGRFGGKQLLDSSFVETALSSPLPPALPRTAMKAGEMLPGQRSIGGGAGMEGHEGCYSYFWWLNRETSDGSLFFPDAPPDTFAALGHGGKHALVVVPSLDLVVSWVVGFRDGQPRNVSSDGRRVVNEALRLLVTALAKDPE